MVATDSNNYLELRQKFKESLRRQMKIDSTSLLDKKMKDYNSYGSFFGPTETVMTQRVIKTLMENPQQWISNSNSKSKPSKKLVHASSVPVVATESKVQMLKNNRDYSFLFSDTAQVLPVPPNDGSRQPQQDLQPKILNKVKIILKKTVPQKQVVLSDATPSAVPEKTIRNATQTVIPEKIMPDNIMHKPVVSKATPSAVPEKTISKVTQMAISHTTVQKPVVPKTKQKPVVPKTKQKPVVPKTKQTDVTQKRMMRELQELPKRDYSEDLKAFSIIRKMFGNNRRKYKYDDDINNMEASFDDIMKEESRSAKLAAKEDEEQLREIEEEKRGRMIRNDAKKRRLV